MAAGVEDGGGGASRRCHRLPLDQLGFVGGVLWEVANLVPQAPGPHLLFIALHDKGPPAMCAAGRS
jgi:hypothetical protein